MSIPLILITYTAGAGLIGLAIYTFLNQRSPSRIHSVYYAGSVLTILWCASYFVMYLTADPEIAGIAYRAGSVGWTINFSCIYLLSAALMEAISGKKVSSIPGYVILVISSVFLYAGLSGKIYAQSFTRTPGGWWVEHTSISSPWVAAYFIWVAVVVMISLVMLYRTARHARLKRHRRMIAFMIYPLIGTITLTILINMLFPLMKLGNPPLGHVLLSLYLAFIGYSIVKFRVITPGPEFITDPLLFQIDDMVLLTDEQGTIIRLNQAVSDLLGYPTDTLVARSVKTILPGIGSLEPGADEQNAVCQNGDRLPIHCTINPIDDIHGDRIGFFFLLKDLTKIRKLEKLTAVLRASNEDLERLSTTDSLTGMFNRSKITTELQQELQRSRRYGTAFSLILYDIDHFKNINDSFGHAAGDTVLVSISEAVRQSIRETDILGRWGGEEFLIICVNTEKEAAGTLAEKIRTRLETLYIEGIGEVTASFGVTSYTVTDTEDSIIERVDAAMYDAKRRGRNLTSIL